MKFGVREICDVVLKAKANQKIGNKIFYKNEPVIYFDTLKTSSMEGAATTVYAQGGRGNARLMAWEGERTLTFTMEDALISPTGFAILSGAGLIDASEEKSIKVHTTETVIVDTDGNIYVAEKPYIGDAGADWIYVMKTDDNGNPNTEPYIYTSTATSETVGKGWLLSTASAEGRKNPITGTAVTYTPDEDAPVAGDIVLVDYYTAKSTGAYQIDITPDKFGGYYYLEASTLFRDENGVDMPAEFVIPKCKIQSNFTFTMASSGDPSTFTFTIDAFPDYTRFDRTEKVLASIQVITTGSGEDILIREQTVSNHTVDSKGAIIDDDESQAAIPVLDGDGE